MSSTRASPATLPSRGVSSTEEKTTLRPLVANGSLEDLPRWVERVVNGAGQPGTCAREHVADRTDPADATELAARPEADAQAPHRPGRMLGFERRAGQVVLRSIQIPDAAALLGRAFSDAVRDAYRLLLRAEPRAQLVRAWNFVPDIRRVFGAAEAGRPDQPDHQLHRCHSESLDRYMLFNAGRAAGFRERPRRDASPEASRHSDRAPFPAATGVGHAGRDFVVHGLFVTTGTSDSSAPNRAPWHVEPIENPRQVPAWRYSPRWGPTPPSFARATRLHRGERSLLLVSGTASVRGEASRHEADVMAQLAESLENLRSVVRSALPLEASGDPLERFTSVRVYVPRSEDVSTITAAIERSALAGAEREFVVAPLCREELLVEIEGVVAGDDGMEVFRGPGQRLDSESGARP